MKQRQNFAGTFSRATIGYEESVCFNLNDAVNNRGRHGRSLVLSVINFVINCKRSNGAKTNKREQKETKSRENKRDREDIYIYIYNMINENKKRNILYIYIRIYRYILQVNIHIYVHTRAHERKYVGTRGSTSGGHINTYY